VNKLKEECEGTTRGLMFELKNISQGTKWWLFWVSSTFSSGP
jgi:hypothetical protein